MARGIPQPSSNDVNSTQRSSRNEQYENMNNHRNRIALALPVTAIPLYTPTPSVEEVQEGGEILFYNFVTDQIQQDSENQPPMIEASNAAVNSVNNNIAIGHAGMGDLCGIELPYTHSIPNGTPEGYKTHEWVRTGREIRELANAFAASQHGAQVRQRAEETVITDITEVRFLSLLEEVFCEGFSRERVIALFYYCALLIVRSRRSNNVTLTGQLFTWSLQYIRDQVCRWVYEHGGWGRVIRGIWEVLMRTAAVVLAGTMIASLFVYIRKNW